MFHTQIVCPHEDPYASLILQTVRQAFPQIAPAGSADLLELLTSALVSTSQTRFGPVPGPESLVEIRKVVRKALTANQPLPVVVPFGSRKPVLGQGLDLAELFALKTLKALQDRVSAHYAPGLDIRVRIEDVSGDYFFVDEGEPARVDARAYCRKLVDLVGVLGWDGFIQPVLESSLFSAAQFEETIQRIYPYLLEYLEKTDLYGLENPDGRALLRAMTALGWQGAIPLEQRDYYRNRYAKWYGGITPQAATIKLARYLAAAWARIQLHGYGGRDTWGWDFLKVTFVPPVPGSPAGLVDKNLYYRVLPQKFSREVLPPWRAKGYWRIGEHAVCPKITAWGEGLTFQPFTFQLAAGSRSVEIQSDYVLGEARDAGQ